MTILIRTIIKGSLDFAIKSIERILERNRGLKLVAGKDVQRTFHPQILDHVKSPK
jgi:hypothetical protein